MEYFPHRFTVSLRPKRVAKMLKKELAACGYDFSLVRCQTIAARMYGYRNLHELNASLGAEPSPPDDEVDEATEECRFQTHVAALLEFGLDRENAERIVDNIGPTARKLGMVRDEDGSDIPIRPDRPVAVVVVRSRKRF